ncbi:MAG TPA: LL-diaminopimelate aminotransferase, partial [Lachnospiraceae bacterium]|nr:LL-diaminopimelate aminotransferase [Lachnospiraceae bacterium]
MVNMNQNFSRLQGNYLFSTIAQKVASYQEEHPGKNIIRLGIGDVTQ